MFARNNLLQQTTLLNNLLLKSFLKRIFNYDEELFYIFVTCIELQIFFIFVVYNCVRLRINFIFLNVLDEKSLK